ncbi:MAG TPA: UxaA family hydrolase, partial [Planctomycetaceae bacterium]|nr:UxaA family hydrolase [Planctomycetaceae bacterium]
MALATAPSTLHLHPDDNIAVATRPIPKDAPLNLTIQGHDLFAREAIDLGHKVAVKPIAKGDPILKFGQMIGFATCAIHPGQWVHTHNVEAGELSLD